MARMAARVSILLENETCSGSRLRCPGACGRRRDRAVGASQQAASWQRQGLEHCEVAVKPVGEARLCLLDGPHLLAADAEVRQGDEHAARPPILQQRLHRKSGWGVGVCFEGGRSLEEDNGSSCGPRCSSGWCIAALSTHKFTPCAGKPWQHRSTHSDADVAQHSGGHCRHLLAHCHHCARMSKDGRHVTHMQQQQTFGRRCVAAIRSVVASRTCRLPLRAHFA